ncbi:putative peptidoglycan lipid II flippase [Streptomyces sp. B3I7]|uniref:lipid II flippase MurJ n=1 Tax=Streptomyces sp. B3I7 TaxID=3042269 RepID=UPI002783758B|nr:lipid II flippase MurJ [Streptomyces sp. B3I7]MDQ0813357.1 putative peptidoglycan lipid II flippase [Streptomyces sp. B3I7]
MTVTPPHTDADAAAATAAGTATGAPPVPAARAATDPARAGLAPATGRFLARAALVTIGLSVAGAVLGLGRDQALARLFGAGPETDAFLVAWTVPEFAATLLIEDGLAFVLVPAFSRALARRAEGGVEDPVRALVRATLPRLLPVLLAVSALLIAGAPYLVAALAPGLPDPRLAVDCTRLTATCVLSFGLAGYCSAALRAHRRFVAPAAIYVAYNIAIIAAMFLLGSDWGVRSAAAGVAAGGLLMAAVQLPSLRRRLRAGSAGPTAGAAGAAGTNGAVAHTATTAPIEPTGTAGTLPGATGPAAPHEARPAAEAAEAGGPPAGVAGTGASPGAAALSPSAGSLRSSVDLATISPVLMFALARQSQVLVERFLGSSLPAGAISHLNYAQKVAQMPMVIALMLCTVTFPVVAQALAEGDTERARGRVERDLALVSCTVLVGAAAVVACAPQIVELLFQRGAFTAKDTEATAAVMRVYALGLLGHTLVGALARSYFSGGRPTWYPMSAMAAGVAVTSCLGVLTVGTWGVCGIAAANAAGVTLSAAALLYGMGARSVPVRIRAVLTEMGRPVRAAAAAAALGTFCASRPDSPVLGLAVGLVVVAVVFFLVAWALGAQAVAPAVRSVTRAVSRRLTHVRSR